MTHNGGPRVAASKEKTMTNVMDKETVKKASADLRTAIRTARAAADDDDSDIMVVPGPKSGAVSVWISENPLKSVAATAVVSSAGTLVAVKYSETLQDFLGLQKK